MSFQLEEKGTSLKGMLAGWPIWCRLRISNTGSTSLRPDFQLDFQFKSFAPICSYHALPSFILKQPKIDPFHAGLLEALIEHWRASLIAVFDVGRDLELGNTKTDAMRKRKREKQENSTKGLRWSVSCCHKPCSYFLFVAGTTNDPRLSRTSVA